MSARALRQSPTAGEYAEPRRPGRGPGHVPRPAGTPLGYVRVEDVTAQLDEVGLHLALVQDEEHVRVPQRLDRLKRELVGVTRPNPDDMNLSHTESLPHATDSGSTASGVFRGDGRVRLRVPAAAAPTSPR